VLDRQRSAAALGARQRDGVRQPEAVAHLSSVRWGKQRGTRKTVTARLLLRATTADKASGERMGDTWR
jgi:hypothetical protein